MVTKKMNEDGQEEEIQENEEDGEDKINKDGQKDDAEGGDGD